MNEHREIRSASHRQTDRRVLFWSFLAAVVAHVLVFALWPTMHTDPESGWTTERLEAENGDGTPLYVELAFGAPEIVGRDGTLIRVERRLEAQHVMVLPSECADRAGVTLPAHGTLRLRVSSPRQTEVVSLVSPTGSSCTDSVITTAGRALDYLWLPNREFPAPVEVFQTVTVLETGDEGMEGP